MDYRTVVRAPTRLNMGGVVAISTTVTDEQDTGAEHERKLITFMTSADCYLLFDKLATMTDIVVADYAGDERCMGPYVKGIVYQLEVGPDSRYFTVITAAGTGIFRWNTDK
jgi:hypothetical protein